MIICRDGKCDPRDSKDKPGGRKSGNKILRKTTDIRRFRGKSCKYNEISIV